MPQNISKQNNLGDILEDVYNNTVYILSQKKWEKVYKLQNTQLARRRNVNPKFAYFITMLFEKFFVLM